MVVIKSAHSAGSSQVGLQGAGSPASTVTWWAASPVSTVEVGLGIGRVAQPRRVRAARPSDRLPTSSGRLSLRPMRRASSSRSAFSQTATASDLDQGAGLGVHEGAAAGGQHMRRLVQQPGDHPALAVAEGRLAHLGEDLGDRAAGRGLDLGVGVAERQVQGGGQAAADAGLARRPSGRPGRWSGGAGRPSGPAPGFPGDWRSGRGRGVIVGHGLLAVYTTARRPAKVWTKAASRVFSRAKSFANPCPAA